MKTDKAPKPLDASLELIALGGEIGIEMIAELCQGGLDGLGMSV